MLRALHTIVAAFLRRTWLVVLVAVVVCASFAARAVAALSDAALTSSAPGPAAAGAAPKAAPPVKPARPRPGATPANADAFAVRNIFCSSCAPPEPGPGPSPEYRGQPAVLIATSIGAEPRATVRVVPTEVQGSWGLGEQIPGVGRVDLIESGAIEVADESGHTKRISLVETAVPAGCDGPGAATPGCRPAGPGQKVAEKEADPFEGRIEKVAEGTYQVERSLVRELVMGTTKAGSVRAFPIADEQGNIKGIRLSGVTKGTVADRISLRSGDVISSIDGVPLRNAQQLIDLFAKLDQISSVDLGGTHGKNPLNLTLRLR